MNQKKQNKLVVFLKYLLFPITIGVFLIKLYLDFNTKKSENSIKKAQLKDDQLKKEQEILMDKSYVHMQTASELAKGLNKEVSEDWHTKR